MIRIAELKLPLSALPLPRRRAADAPAETEADRAPDPHPLHLLKTLAAQALGVSEADLQHLQVFKRSFDARKPELVAVYIVDVALVPSQDEGALLARFTKHPHIHPSPDMAWHPPATAPVGWPRQTSDRPVVVGLGPAGLLAALALAEMGLRPVVFERGHPVRQRTKDTWDLWRHQKLHPGSNVQFGEGGAGLFSDGKLYSQIKDPRFLGRKVIQAFVDAGAPPDILYMAHPHIGTFKLVKVVEAMREKISALGGEIRFQHHVTRLLLEPSGGGEQRVRGVVVQNLADQTTQEHACQHVVLALGHSARDTFASLHEQGIYLEPKAFSVGVRIEHPQGVIDRARWGRHAGHPLLGAADYKLVHHANNGRAVYSFCMCPGGTVVAATSEEGRVVTNGMSQYSRNERNANAGIVVGVDTRDYPTDTGAWVAAFGPTDGARYAEEARDLSATGQTHPLAGVVFQRQLESLAYVAGGSTYRAPGQLVGDFLTQRPSSTWGDVQPSYKPGVTLGDLAEVLPPYALEAMREALPAFGRKIPGFDRPDAVMTGVETRTSSPLRITRDATFQSLNTRGLYPAGEGAGYAGGILSAGVDGIKVAEAVAIQICTPEATPAA